MNPPNSSAPTPSPAAAAVLLSTRPSWMQSSFKLIACLGAFVTLVLSFAEYKDMLPADWQAGDKAVLIGFVTAGLVIIKNALEALGDLFDDGIRNGSFKLGLLALLLVPAFLLSSCVTSKMSPSQLSLADIGYTAAQGAVLIAETTLAEKMADPKTPAWQRLAAQMAFTQAKKSLTREQAKLDAAFAALLAGKVPSDLAMPTYTSAKAALPVLP